jgi:hypothetical protein
MCMRVYIASVILLAAAAGAADPGWLDADGVRVFAPPAGHPFRGSGQGQVHDPSAVAVIARVQVGEAYDPVMLAARKRAKLRVRHLERLALGTPYPDVVTRVREVVRSVNLRGHCTVVADATLGRGTDHRPAAADLESTILPVMITGGDMETSENGYYRVPKRDLIIGLQLLLQQRALKIADGLRDGPALLKEMLAMRVKITLSGHERYEAWREGTHDDLVFAVALGCWAARNMQAGMQEEWCQWDPDPTRV